jgi:hypothetical protein
MNLPASVIALVICTIVAFAIICGLGAVILHMKKGSDGVTAILYGFAAAAAAVTVGCALMGVIAVMA